MQIAPEQCLAAMGLLEWDRKKLAKECDLDRKTIYKFLKELHIKDETISVIRLTLEAAGIVFLDGKDGEYLPTAALRFGYVKPRSEGAEDEPEDVVEKMSRQRAYWDRRPEGLAMVSEEERKAFMNHLSGRTGDEGDFMERAAE